MAVVLGRDVRIDVFIAEANENITAIFPSYDDEGFAAQITKLLKNRYRQVGRRMENRSQEARIAFFDAACIDIEGVEFEVEDGSIAQLNKSVDGWKKKIPANWKASIATAFEEKETLTEEDRGNSESLSEED